MERSIRGNSLCRSCTCNNFNKIINKNNSGSNNTQWKGFKNIPYSWFSRYFERANTKRRTGTIVIKDVYDMWIKQDKKCNLSGVDIGFYDDGRTHTCSIDRIDSSKEYDLSNIQLVHKHINLMKNSFDNGYFIEMCKLIAKHNE